MRGADKSDDVLGWLKAASRGVKNLLQSAMLDDRVGDNGTRNLMILTVATLEIAVDKEDIADATMSAERRFFAGVGIDRGGLGKRGAAVAKARQ